MTWYDLDETPRISYNILLDLWEDSEGDLPVPKVKISFDNPSSDDSHQDIDGWEIHEMESGEYPDHDAIWIDRGNKRMIINYQGHHSPMYDKFHPMMQQATEAQIAGHFRTRPSTTEPFPAGWGWHGGEATPDEKKLLKQVLKHHYQVEALKELYTPDEDAEENYLDLEPEDHEAKVSAPRTVTWLDNDTKNLTWKGLYDILGDKVILWSTDSSGYPHHFERMGYGEDAEYPLYKNIGLEGYYTKPTIPQGDPEYVERAMSLLIPALQERWPVKETNFKKTSAIRWMLRDDGKVLMGSFKTHYELLQKLQSPESAEMYDNNMENSSEYPFITGGFITDKGEIAVVRSYGEPPFDPVDVARKVYAEAKQYGDLVSGEVLYRDDVDETTEHFDVL